MLSEEPKVLEVKEASVLDRGRNGEDGNVRAGDVGPDEEPLEKAGCDGDNVAEASDAADCEREDIGGMRFCRFWCEGCAESGDRDLFESWGGISSAGGIGSPLPAATN